VLLLLTGNSTERMKYCQPTGAIWGLLQKIMMNVVTVLYPTIRCQSMTDREPHSLGAD
jgi:hypothetical protein